MKRYLDARVVTWCVLSMVTLLVFSGRPAMAQTVPLTGFHKPPTFNDAAAWLDYLANLAQEIPLATALWEDRVTRATNIVDAQPTSLIPAAWRLDAIWQLSILSLAEWIHFNLGIEQFSFSTIGGPAFGSGFNFSFVYQPGLGYVGM